MAGAAREVETVSPSFIASVLNILVAKGYLVDQASTLGMEPAVSEYGVTLRRAAYGIGCCNSAAAPLDTLAMHFRQLILNQLLGIQAVCVIAKNLAEESCSANNWPTIEQRALEHLAIAKRFVTVTGAKTEVVLDREINANKVYGQVGDELRSLGLSFLWQEHLGYFRRQHQLFEAARRLLDVQLKLGWTRVTTAEEYRSLKQAWTKGIRPSSACEAAFDALAMTVHGLQQNGARPMAYLYGPPAFTFCARYPVAAPYTVRPCEHGQAANRILLRRGQDLNELIPDPGHCTTTKTQRRIVRAMASLNQLVSLIDETMPLFFDQPRNEALESIERRISSGQEMWHQLVRVHGVNSRESREQATRVNALRIEHASALREYLIPRLKQVLDVFAVS